MTSKKASADWARLSQILHELSNPQHPLYYALRSWSLEETIANAIRSGGVPVRGITMARSTGSKNS